MIKNVTLLLFGMSFGSVLLGHENHSHGTSDHAENVSSEPYQKAFGGEDDQPNAPIASAFFSGFEIRSAGVIVEEELEFSDVGDVEVGGGYEFNEINDRYILKGTSLDIWDASDSFHFLAQPLNSSDLDLRVRVDEVKSAGVWSRSGIMIRKDRNPGSPHMLVAVNPGGQAYSVWRTSEGGSSSYNGGLLGINFPKYLRLVKQGEVFTTYYSVDGVDWVQIEQKNLGFGDQVEAGLAFSSNGYDENYVFNVGANGLPMLESNPDASGVVYLDFEGGSSPWLEVEPYGNGDELNESEQFRVYKVWRDVSHHFAMFDLNVTTIEPDKTQVPTAHILIGPNVGTASAATGKYGKRGDADPDKASGMASTGVAGTTVTHELGHILGLNHQASFNDQGERVSNYRGGDEWDRSPLMGRDNFGGPYTHWANNTATGDNEPVMQDDVSWIARVVIEQAIEFYGDYDGDGFREDDYPNDLSNAESVSLENIGFDNGKAIFVANGFGVIERYTDKDIFAIDWLGGNLAIRTEAVKNLTARPIHASSVGLNVRLLDASANVVASDFASDPADVFAEVIGDRPAGRYYIEVSGAEGEADLGKYRIGISGVSPINIGDYQEWVASHDDLVQNGDTGLSDNPDNDSMTNFQEFAFNMNPMKFDSCHPVACGTLMNDGNDFFQVTLPVRKGAVFQGDSSQEATVGGIRYLVETSNNLKVYDRPVIAASLPPNMSEMRILDPQWEYRRFVIPIEDKGFIRVKVEPSGE